MKGFRRLALASLLLAFHAAPASSCPVCNEPTGKEVRAGIFNEDFAFNLLSTVLPFGVFLGITAAIHFGFPPGRASSASRSPLHLEARGDPSHGR